MNRGMKGSEDRLFQRVSCAFPVQVKVLPSTAAINAKSCDLSGGGMGIITKQSLKPGEEVTLRINFSSRLAPLMNRARIIWSRQEASGFWRTGVQFSSPQLYRLSPLFKHS